MLQHVIPFITLPPALSCYEVASTLHKNAQRGYCAFVAKRHLGRRSTVLALRRRILQHGAVRTARLQFRSFPAKYPLLPHQVYPLILEEIVGTTPAPPLRPLYRLHGGRQRWAHLSTRPCLSCGALGGVALSLKSATQTYLLGGAGRPAGALGRHVCGGRHTPPSPQRTPHRVRSAHSTESAAHTPPSPQRIPQRTPHRVAGTAEQGRGGAGLRAGAGACVWRRGGRRDAECAATRRSGGQITRALFRSAYRSGALVRAAGSPSFHSGVRVSPGQRGHVVLWIREHTIK